MFGRSHRLFWFYASLAALGLGAPGCTSDASDRAPQAVAGTVTLDGRPMKFGTIMLFPSGDGKAIKNISDTELILNGRFLVPRSKGVLPGRYRIAVFEGSDPGRSKPASGSETGPTTPTDRLPARFNVDTELEVEITSRSIKELRIEVDSK
jgi:hypothetical protein